MRQPRWIGKRPFGRPRGRIRRRLWRRFRRIRRRLRRRIRQRWTVGRPGRRVRRRTRWRPWQRPLSLYGGAGRPLQPLRSGATARRASPGVGGGVPVPRPGTAAVGRSPDARCAWRSQAATAAVCSPYAGANHDRARAACTPLAPYSISSSRLLRGGLKYASSAACSSAPSTRSSAARLSRTCSTRAAFGIAQTPL